MARVKLQLPETFSFTTQIPVRITDINYGGHVGNDSILSLLHEARMQFLAAAGYTEMNVEGVGLIMADAEIEFKGEAFYGEILTAAVAAGDFTRVGFVLYYKLVKGEAEIPIVRAKTGMICFDYGKRKVVSVPAAAFEKLSR